MMQQHIVQFENNIAQLSFTTISALLPYVFQHDITLTCNFPYHSRATSPHTCMQPCLLLMCHLPVIYVPLAQYSYVKFSITSGQPCIIGLGSVASLPTYIYFKAFISRF